MTPKLFTGLAITAALSLGAAAMLYSSGNQWTSGQVAGEKLFPRFSKKIENLAKLEIKQGDQSLTFVKKNDEWQIKERDNFPVKPERIRSILFQLEQAELIEPKTSNKDRYHLLELEDPAKKDAKSRIIRLLDKDNQKLAEVIIGKSRWDAFGSGKSGVYIRKPGEEQSWLSNTKLSASLDMKEWVDSLVFNIDSKNIKSVKLKAPDEEEYVIETIPGKDGEFQLAGVGKEEKIKEGSTISDIPNAFGSIELEDARKLTATPTGKSVNVIKLVSKDGLNVEFRLRKEREGFWLSLTASGSGDAKDKADTLNKRVENWEYKISNWKAGSLFKRKSELIETS